MMPLVIGAICLVIVIVAIIIFIIGILLKFALPISIYSAGRNVRKGLQSQQQTQHVYHYTPPPQQPYYQQPMQQPYYQQPAQQPIQQPQPPAMKYCPSCRAPNPLQAKFCTGCAKPFGPTTTHTSTGDE